MSTIPTARGDAIDVSELGFTLMHEHTFNLSPEVNQNYPELWGDEDARVEDAVRQYREAKAVGVDTIVDVTVFGLGRFIPRIQRIAEQVELNIVVATGVYIWQALPMFFAVNGPTSARGGPETMDDLFVRDIEEGIGDTGVRAGILKVATDRFGLTPDVERVLRATAKAHRRTGVPITTHTHDAPNGLEQQRILGDEGVDLSRVIIGHVDVAASKNVAYVEAILDAGSYIGIDQFGVPNLDDERRLDVVAELCRAGWADRVVLSHDHNCYCDMVPATWFAERSNWSKTYLPTKGVAGLLDRGFPAAQIRQMTVENPAKVFRDATKGGY